jgi:thiol-disulfide isomerase/thioredoxin
MTYRAVAGIAAAVLVAMLTAIVPAGAGAPQKYDPAAFAAAQKAGQSILVHVTAPWCPTCKAQHPIVESLAAKPEFKDLAIFEIDFDTGRDALIALKARSQSTLILFKGDKETGRSVGDTSPESIEALFKTAL